MCLLITQPAEVKWSKDDVKDFFSRNKDGIGLMYAEDNTLHIKKILPNSAKDAIKFLNEHAGKDCAIHFRMATHGLIDTDNCHPYEVLSQDTGHPMWMMHNGILSTGNKANTSKSDTWHFVNDYLRPLLDPTVGGDPELIQKPAFQFILGEMIGNSNKLVFMNYEGKITTINAEAGVKYKGAWLSNTYAWSSYKGGHYGKYDMYEDDGFFGIGNRGLPYVPSTQSGAAGTKGTLASVKELPIKDVKTIYDDDSEYGLEEEYNRLITSHDSVNFEYDERAADVVAYIREFRVELGFTDMRNALRALSEERVAAFISINSFSLADSALDALQNGAITEAQFILFILTGSRQKRDETDLAGVALFEDNPEKLIKS